MKYLEKEYQCQVTPDDELQRIMVALSKYLCLPIETLSKVEINSLFIYNPSDVQKLNSYVSTIYPKLALPNFNDFNGKKRYLKRIGKWVKKQSLPPAVKLLMDEVP